MKGILCKENLQFLSELHHDRKFEIFTALDGVPKPKSKRSLYVMWLDDIDDDARDNEAHNKIQQLNDAGRGIWFTANSMFNGKRLVECIESFNAIGLDLDSGKEGNDRDIIEKSKQTNLKLLLNLQLTPTVIIETKNGLQPFWFLQPNEINNNDEYKALQKMMQIKLGADPGAIGGERLYRLPGYYHQKDPLDPFLIKIVHADYNKRYTKQELVHKFGGQKKLKSLTKKSVGNRYTGKPIELDEFKHPGNVLDVAVGCRVFAALEQKKAPSHQERLALLFVYMNLGKAGLDRFRQIAKGWNDYNENLTEYMIRQALTQGYRPITCQWLIDNGICPGKCVNISDNRSPRDFYFHPMPALPNRMDMRE